MLSPLLLTVLAVVIVFGGLSFRRYTGLARGKALLALLASVIACGVRIYYREEALRPIINNSNNVEVFARIAASGVFIVFLTAFVLRLWGRWVGGNATVEEREPGLPGIGTWFSASNVFVGGMLVLTAWLGYNTSPLVSIIVVSALLGAYPIIRMESPAVAPTPVVGDLSPEREKIVSMLEAGKLTVEESAELLQALGGSARAAARQVPLTGSQRLLFAGAALVALGFFLPWFVINPGKEAARMMGWMQEQGKISGNSPLDDDKLEPSIGVPFGDGQISTPTVTLAGGDIQRGLGWATLFLALAAALIPYVATTLDAATAGTARLLCLGMGGLIVLYLVTQNIRFVGVGLVIAVGGYALEIAGAMRERRTTNA